MKLTFRIQYRTVWGEDIRVILNDDTEHPIALSTRDGNNWIGTTNYEAPVACVQVTYRYGVFCNGVCVRKEFESHSAFFRYRECPADSLHHGRLLA